jgi:hypothetical protein
MGDPLDNFSLLKYPVREWKFKLPWFHEAVAVNPVVTFVAAVCLWGMVLLNTGMFFRHAAHDHEPQANLTSTIMLSHVPS